MALIPISRFAPSPTGLLHLGHAWSAIQAHDLARNGGGHFLLRIEDIDAGRCRPEFVGAIFKDLAWLGLQWDGKPVFQSARMDVYCAALQQLAAEGLVYRCWCTRAEIAASASAPQGPMGALYPGTCKGRADPDDGRPFCWRLDVEEALHRTGPLDWRDIEAGRIAAEPARLGDVVIARKDMPASYHLAVTLDDAAQQVTHVVRGMDLFESTHIHRLLQALLGLPVPEYRHHRLVGDAGGERLAKRKGSASLAELRAAGLDGHALASDLRQDRLPLGFAFAGV